MVPLRSPTKRLPSGVEGCAGGHAHALGVDGEFAGVVDAVDVALGAGGDEEVAVGGEGQAGGVEDAGDEGGSAAVGADADDGDGCLLAAGAGDGGVDHAGAADGGAGDGVQAVGELAGHAEGAVLLAPEGLRTSMRPVEACSGTRKARRVGRLMRTWAGLAVDQDGGRDRRPRGPRWAPSSSISPSGQRGGGDDVSRCVDRGGLRRRIGCGGGAWRV